MTKTIIVDAGRNAVKCLCNGQRRIFPSVVSPAHEFQMEVNTTKDDCYWIRLGEQELFIGRLAVEQSAFGTQDRSRDKSNFNNRAMIICAVSMFAFNEDVHLITNCPARDWAKQRQGIAESLQGHYSIPHRCGKWAGMLIDFNISKVSVLPEGTGAFYGFVYDEKLNLSQPKLMNAETLVLEIGDETINHLVFRDGEYVDSDCGSLDLGLRVAHVGVQKWLEQEGRELSLAEIARHIVNEQPVYVGNRPVYLIDKAQQEYENLARIAFSRLTGKFTMSRFRSVLLAGGGADPLYESLSNLFNSSDVYAADEGEGQWLNAIGFERMDQLRKRGM